KPVEFTLTLRIPGSAASASVDGEAAEPGSLVTLKRVWEGKSVVALSLGFETTFVRRPTGLYSLERGPLVYALKIGEDWTKLEYERGGVERKFPYCDWEVRPTTEWQYAFDGLDPEKIEIEEKGETGELPFAPENAPCILKVPVRQINWGYESEYRMVARAEPLSAMPVGPEKTAAFIPYGCTDIRLTELPEVDIPEA
ncbi:MAG: glycoside hydrolase family 127 protein, partial [Clostridia bacterium]|nr:glycoside hydrolase family 127 protein [Clostridia bacterium]